MKNWLSPAKIGFISGCLLSIVIILLYPGFNPDGVLYLYAAQLLQSHQWQQAMTIYSWPFFSASLALLSTCLHVSLLNAAYFYNVIFFAISVSVFVKIIQTLGGNRTVQWLALLSILFYRAFNKYNYYVMRDQGYWCFILLSLFILLEFFKYPTWYKAILWGVCLSIATLFRMEGVAFIIFMPFTVLCCDFSWRVKILAWLKLNTLSIFIVLVLLGYIIFHPHSSILQTPRANELRQDLFHSLTYVSSQFFKNAGLMAQYVLPDIAKGNASGVLFSGLLTYYAYLVLGVIGWPYVLVIVYAWYRGVRFLRNQRNVIWAYILINMGITLLFTFTKVYFVDRYFQTLALCFLLFVPFGFLKLYQDFVVEPKNRWKKILMAFVLLGWAAMVVSSLSHIGPSKRYIQHAKTWIIANIPENASIVTNIGQLHFMTNRPMSGWECQVLNASTCYDWKNLPAPFAWKGAQYLVLDLPQDDIFIASLTQKIGHAPLQVFLQKRPKREVVIYKI